MRRGFLYLAQPDDMPIYKVGVAGDVAARLHQFQSQSPHTMRVIRVLDLGPRWRANAYERYIHSWLTPYSSHGEWFTNLQAIHEQFDQVAPAVDVTDQIPSRGEPKSRHRPPMSLDHLDYILACDEARASGLNVSGIFGVAYSHVHKPRKDWRKRLQAYLDKQDAA